MEFLKKFFGDKALTFEELKNAVQADGSVNPVDLSSGDYVSKEKLDRKIGELKTVNETLSQMKNYQEDLKAVRKTLEDFQKRENDRQAEEAKANKMKEVKDRFSRQKGEKAFLNAFTEQGVFEEFQKALTLQENEGKSDAEIYEAITKDKNIYENPNKLTIPPVGNPGENDDGRTSLLMRAMGLQQKEE